MTLDIGVAAPAFACIVTDRRLSGGRKVEESTKCGTVYFQNARLIYAFSGLAEHPAEQFITRRWLAEALCDAGEGGVDVDTAMNRLREAANLRFAQFSRLQPKDSALSVLFVGYVNAVPAMFLLSNCETSSNPPTAPVSVGDFNISSQTAPDGMALATAIGSGRAWITRQDWTKLVEAANLKAPPALILRIVELIRRISDQDARKTVGKQCSSVLLSPDAEVGFMEDYHSTTNSEVAPTPAFVEARYGKYGAYMIVDYVRRGAGEDTGAILAVASVNKNAKCPCGSGRKYKSCHRRRKPGGKLSAFHDTVYFMYKALPDDGSDVTLVSVYADRVSLSR